MCRALAYLGQPVLLDNLLYQPDSALVKQSYMPKMLHMLNLAGFGLKAWDHSSFDAAKPFSYASTSLPVFDRNLKALAEKIRPACVLAHNGDLARMRDMKPELLRHIRPEIAQLICGTTDSEWIYALIASRLDDPRGDVGAAELVRAVDQAMAIIREIRARLDIATSSSLNLFITTGTQIAAVRYCFDFGCYRTEDPARVHEANLNFLSLWYTSGREYGQYDGEWKMIGGADTADSIMVASEPLTRDTSTWLEVPEYSMIYADTRGGRPTVEIHYLD